MAPQSLPTYSLLTEKGRLLESENILEDDIDRNEICGTRTPAIWTTQRLLILSLILNAVLVVISAGSVLGVIKLQQQSGHGPNLIHSPAREAVQYRKVLMNNSLEEENPFKGSQPNPVQTDAWRELLSWQMMVVSEDDLRAVDRFSETSVKFEDGSGYLAELDVYHELHCLNYIREYIHRDYYSNVETPEVQIIHVDHCIDTLRQIMMCHADISLVTYDWVDGRLNPYPNFAIERECRDWDSILAYSKAHQPVIYDGAYVNPKLGPVPIKPLRHPWSDPQDS